MTKEKIDSAIAGDTSRSHSSSRDGASGTRWGDGTNIMKAKLLPSWLTKSRSLRWWFYWMLVLTNILWLIFTLCIMSVMMTGCVTASPIPQAIGSKTQHSDHTCVQQGAWLNCYDKGKLVGGVRQPLTFQQWRVRYDAALKREGVKRQSPDREARQYFYFWPDSPQDAAEELAANIL